MGNLRGGCLTNLVLAGCLLSCLGVAAFSSNNVKAGRSNVDLSMSLDPDFLGKVPSLPNLFSKEESSEDSLTMGFGSGDGQADLSFDTLIGKAKSVIATDLAIQDPTLLSEDFIWIGPLLEKPLGKVDYLAAGKFFNLRAAFPDLDYRAHDFRVDVNDPFTVRCTVRPLGTMRGQLRLRNEIVEPNGKQWRGPPEAISMTFDPKTGKLVKLCSSFVMDRFVGNTNGLCGVMAAATVAGVPPSDWEVYPIPSVISRFFGRPVDPVQEVSTFLAPFPETVMIQLAKGIISTNLASEDPSLLAKDFTFVTPSVGPVGKNKFLESYAAQEFGGFEPEVSHFRVDPYDPYRVWVDVKPVGPGLEGPPQAFSFAFDEDGFCTRMTAGAVMDPSIGNTGGLTGEQGIRYALGEGGLDFATRPLPVAIGRLKKTILSPITKITADDYRLDAPKPLSETTQANGETASAPEDSMDDPAIARRVLAEARARFVEEENRKKEAEREKEQLFRAQQEAEAERVRAQEEAKRKAQQALELAMKKIQQETKPQVPPKPTSATPIKKTSPPRSKPPTEAAQSKPLFFMDVIKPLTESVSSLEQAKPKVSAPAAETRRKQLDAKKAAEEKKRKEAEAQSRAAAAEKQRREVEERKAEQLEARKKQAEEKQRQETERKQAAQLEALKRQAEEKQRQEAERKKAEQLEARKKQAEEKQRQETERKQAAQLEARKKQAEEKQQEAERKKAEQLEARQKQDEEKKKEAERRRAEQLELRKKQAEAAKAAAEQKRKEAAEKRAAAEEARRRKAEEMKAARDLSQKQAAEKKAEAEKQAAAEKARRAAASQSNVKSTEMATPFAFSQFNLSPPKIQEAPKSLRRSIPLPKAPEATRSSIPIPEKTTSPRPSLSLFGAPVAPRPSMAVKQTEQKPPSKPRPTLSLFDVPVAPRPSVPVPSRPSVPVAARPSLSVKPKEDLVAPKGVPILVGWRKRPNGGVSGQIFGSVNFKEGERVETSTITSGVIENGNVVVTESGSRYFLSNKTAKEMKDSMMKSAPGPKELSPSKPRATLQLTKKAREDEAQTALAALKAAEKAAPQRSTFSLTALFGFDKKTETKPKKGGVPSAKTSRSPIVKKAPRGVPSIGRWKQNRDKSITGFISGSPAFPDGEKVTTSPISKGTIGPGEVVVTSSGTRYFLQ